MYLRRSELKNSIQVTVDHYGPRGGNRAAVDKLDDALGFDLPRGNEWKESRSDRANNADDVAPPTPALHEEGDGAGGRIRTVGLLITNRSRPPRPCWSSLQRSVRPPGPQRHAGDSRLVRHSGPSSPGSCGKVGLGPRRHLNPAWPPYVPTVCRRSCRRASGTFADLRIRAHAPSNVAAESGACGERTP